MINGHPGGFAGLAATAWLALGVTAGQAASDTSMQTSRAMQTDHESQASAARPIEIQAGSTAAIGGWTVGAIAVGDSARVAVGAYPSGVQAEFVLQLRKHELMPAGDGLHRVESVVPASGASRGHLSVAASPDAATAGKGQVEVYLAREGRVRVNGPDTHGASDLRITAWGADAASPSADVEWSPSQFAPEDTDPSTIQRAHLTPGSHLVIGRTALTVAAIEAQTADHPAWIRFEVSAAH